MKLKKMEITGFKSFVDKSHLEFPEGVSAIVGPNGCGKSNIVDALRWAMGEQSVKQLRGKSMEDVIFAGANGRPPVNLAEVSLVLSNENGDAPDEYKQFSEIMITRRLYRSGESAYLINKKNCRLKDIFNLFAGSGLGAKSYAVIQQGNIGAITEAGQDERRFFIEEAAGITRYKARKNEALKKIESTNQNLLRLTDIISEVERQMKALRRQAKKAERYKSIREKIKDLDVRLSLYHFNDCSEKIEKTAALLQSLKDADLSHSSEIQKIDAAVEDIKLARYKKNREISEHKSEYFDLQRKIDKIENDLVHLRKDKERLTGEITELETAGKELAAKNTGLHSEIVKAREKSDQFREAQTDIKDRIEKNHEASREISDKIGDLKRKLQEAQAGYIQLVERENEYKNTYRNVSDNKANLKRRLKKIDEEAVLVSRDVAAVRSKETEAKKNLETIKDDLAYIDEQILEIKSKLGEQTGILGHRIKETQTLDIERNKAKSKYGTLKKMEDNFDWYKDGVKAIMKTAADGVVLNGGVLGITADFIEPEPSYETALESVLGEALQYIVVEDETDCFKAVDYLKTSEKGRCGFIPVSRMKAGTTAGDEAETSDRLIRHVSVRNGYQSILENLLQGAVVAEDLSQALKLSEIQPNGAIVTKDGDVITSSGMIIGGSKDKLSGILVKKQEIKELDAQIRELEDKYDSARLAQKETEQQVKSLETELQKKMEEKSIFTRDETEAEKAVFKITQEIKHTERRLALIHEEQQALQDEEYDMDKEMARHNQAMAEISGEVEAAKSVVDNLEARIADVSSQMDSFNQHTMDLKLELTSLNAKLENSEATLNRLVEFQQEGKDRLDKLQEDIDKKVLKVEMADRNIEQYTQSLSGMYDDMNRISHVLETHQNDFEEIEAKLLKSDEQISELQSKREETLEKIRIIDVELTQLNIKRENIANRLEERYHKTIGEFRGEYEDISLLKDTAVKEMEDKLSRHKDTLSKIGDVNLGAIREYEELKERFEFLNTQQDDLVKAIEDLHKVIRKINRISQERFLNTFNLINEKMNVVFPRLFNGGAAKLVLTDPGKPLETGVEFMVHPPGKNLTRLSLLSGGEKALSAIAFIFSIFLIKPTSFCILDEIDAPLDEANVYRFNELLKIIGEKSQIILITHKKKSMEFADMLFGVTMEKKGVSKIVSVSLEKSEIRGEENGLVQQE